MELLITSQEAVELAFEGTYGITPDRIGRATVIAAQQKYIRPVLGKLYGRIESGAYPELLEKVKPVLAHYVKSLLIPQLAVSVGNGGVTAVKGQYFESADQEKTAALRENIRSEACAMMRDLVEHIEENRERYPEYDPADNILNRTSICSGIIL